MRSRPVRDGVRDISRWRDPDITRWLAEFEPVVPTVCAVSWSIEPTSWVDSYHRTLNGIAPGHAHDARSEAAGQPGVDGIRCRAVCFGIGEEVRGHGSHIRAARCQIATNE